MVSRAGVSGDQGLRSDETLGTHVQEVKVEAQFRSRENEVLLYMNRSELGGVLLM